MPPRKRRRSQAFPESNQEDSEVINEDLKRQASSDPDKERDVWDSFREEHFEGTSIFCSSFYFHF